MSDPDQSASPPREPQGGDDRRLDFRPGMGMWWEITRNAVDTSGELFEATNWIEPRMPGPPVHVHPTAEESYEVIEGALEVFIDGKWRPVRAGEKATVAAGVPHSVRNATDQPAKIINIHQPAQRFESFFRDMHRLIHEGKIKHLPPKEPRSAIYAAMLFGKYPDEIRATKPPNQIFQALAFVGKGAPVQGLDAAVMQPRAAVPGGAFVLAAASNHERHCRVQAKRAVTVSHVARDVATPTAAATLGISPRLPPSIAVAQGRRSC